jgi:hypothetical protein
MVNAKLLALLALLVPCCGSGLPVPGAALDARLIATPEAAAAPPTYISVNPLSGLAALPSVHYAYQGIDGSCEYLSPPALQFWQDPSHFNPDLALI